MGGETSWSVDSSIKNQRPNIDTDLVLFLNFVQELLLGQYEYK